MISVILIWIYALITVFLLGYGFAAIWKKITGYSPKDVLPFFMAGLVTVTVYAQTYSLFAGVGLTAHLLLLILCLMILLLWRKEMGSDLSDFFRHIKKKDMVAVTLLFLLMAYGTSKGYMHYDTALYHAQSIRWIEEYGVVRGLGNLHCRLAYNSASFALTAFYGMKFLGTQSFHVMAGFLAFLLLTEVWKITRAIDRKRLLLSDYARIMALYYLLIIFDEMVSPASDYFMVLTCFYLVIRWLSLLEKGENRPEPYGLLCLLGVYLVTVKLSAAVILLLTVLPAFGLMREKKYGTIAAYLAAGVLIAAPYLIRNVVISGWLVYPFTQIDLFSVNWKIPKGLADYDAREIQVWGRGYTDVLQYDLPMSRWFGGWFGKQTGMDKLFILASFGGIAVLCIKYGFVLYRCMAGKKAEKKNAGENRGDKNTFWVLYTETVLAACFLFWVSTSPLIRYGCVYVWLTGVLIWAEVLERACENRYVKRTLYTLLLLFGCYKLCMFSKELVSYATTDYLVRQQEYDNYPVEAYEICGETFYKALQGDQTGYEPFPSSPTEAKIQFRGSTVKDGFTAE